MAVSFARKGFPVVGFDVDLGRITELNAGYDRTHEVETGDLRHATLSFSSELAAIRKFGFLHRHRADADR